MLFKFYMHIQVFFKYSVRFLHGIKVYLNYIPIIQIYFKFSKIFTKISLPLELKCHGCCHVTTIFTDRLPPDDGTLIPNILQPYQGKINGMEGQVLFKIV